jgi:hypothetical protein
MKNIVLGSVALSFLLLTVILHLQVQPAGQARVLRSDQKLLVVKSRVGWTQGWAMQSCLVPVERGWLRFHERFAPPAADGEGIGMEVDFTYRFPPSLAGWPEGDWCEALSSVTAGELESRFSSTSSDQSSAHPREASEVAAHLKESLRRRGLEVQDVAVRLGPAPDATRTQPIPPNRN